MQFITPTNNTHLNDKLWKQTLGGVSSSLDTEQYYRCRMVYAGVVVIDDLLLVYSQFITINCANEAEATVL